MAKFLTDRRKSRDSIETFIDWLKIITVINLKKSPKKKNLEKKSQLNSSD